MGELIRICKLAEVGILQACKLAEVCNLSNCRKSKLRLTALTLVVSLGIVTWGQEVNPLPQKSDRISGRIVNANDGSPLERARVSIQRNDSAQAPPRSVVTGADGQFVFEQVAPGKYSLLGARRGFLDAAYDQHGRYSTAIVIGAGLDTGNLTLRLEPMAIISGKVIDEAGEAVRNAQVRVYRDINQAGQGATRTMAGTQTDDLGNFEVTSVRPGNYFVSATATPWYAIHPPSTDPSGDAATGAAPVNHGLDVAYPTTFYADATEFGDATPIPVKGGDRVEVEIHMSPVPAMHLVFRRAPGNEVNGFQMPSLLKSTPDGFEPVQTEMRGLGGDLYEIDGVPEGKYKVQISMPGQPMRTSELSVTADGQELDATAGEASGSLKATIVLADGSKVTPGFHVELFDLHRKPVTGKQLDDKGEGLIADIEPGEYIVDVFGPARAYTVTSVVSDGVEAAGHTIKIAAGAERTMMLMVASGAGRVKGFVKRDGVPVAGAMVVLVPKEPGSYFEQFRLDQSDLDGSFDLNTVAAGTYKLVAIEDGWKLEWSKPGVIAHYLLRSQSLTVTGNQGRPVELVTPLIPQPK